MSGGSIIVDCANGNHNEIEALFKEAIEDFVVQSVSLHRTFKKKFKCYWSVDMVAKPGKPFPFVWSKASLKSLAEYFIAMKPRGSNYEGIVETKRVVQGRMVEGATAYFSVYRCACVHFFDDVKTKFAFELLGGSLIQKNSFKKVLQHVFTNFEFNLNSDVEDDGKNSRTNK